jgi:hypothetical protein
VAQRARQAHERLALEVARPWAPEVHAVAGLPQPEQAAASFEQLRRALPMGSPA